MAIRDRFLAVLAGFALVFLPGTPAPVDAESGFSDLADAIPLEPVAIPPPLDDFERLPPGEATAEASGAVPGPAGIPEAIEPAPEIDPWAEAFAESARLEAAGRRLPEHPPYVVETNPQVGSFVERFTGSRREVVALWFRRSGRYLGMIREVLQRHGLPDDLVYMVMIESGFDPQAVSRAGATGLWQFMASTARRYGLRVDRWVDERLDPERSSAAAAAYLRDLHAQFGSWLLAQAAYNAGELVVARAVRRTGSADFWTLTRTGLLRRETKDFVPSIQAMTLLGRDPARFGFEVGGAEAPDVERVAVPAATSLRKLAAAAGLSAAMLRALNPVLLRGVTPPGAPWDLRVPGGTRAGVLAALAPRAPTGLTGRDAGSPTPGRAVSRASGGSGVHVVRPRDTLAAIAKRYGVSIGDVVRWNELDAPDRIHPGDRLRVAERR